MKEQARPNSHETVSSRSAAQRIVSWCLVVLWAAFIFFMSAQTDSDLSSGFFAAFKQWAQDLLNGMFGYHEDPLSPVCHFAEYLILGVLLSNAIGWRDAKGKVFLIAVALASAYGISDEVHQAFVPGRVPDLADWAIDTAGASLGAAIWTFVHAFAVQARGARGMHTPGLDEQEHDGRE